MSLEKQIELLTKGLTDLTQIVTQQQEIISKNFESNDNPDDKPALKDDEVSPAMKELVDQRKVEAEAKVDSARY